MDKSHEPLNQHLINLPAGTTHIKVGDVPDLLASAFYPLPDSYGRISSRESNKRGVEKAVKAGTITPLIPDSLEDHPFPFGDALDNSVITIEDFALLAKKARITLVIDRPAKVRTGDTASKDNKPNLPEGIPTGTIVAKFRLEKNWEDKLKHIDRNPFLLDALLRKGSRKIGKTPVAPHLWNPVKIAWILNKRGDKTSRAMEAVIKNHFKAWEDVWIESYEDAESSEFETE